MNKNALSRRELLAKTGQGALAATAAAALSSDQEAAADSETAAADEKRGAQRLSLDSLRKWESLGYGMFIHYGMSTFVQAEIPDGKAPVTAYAPDKLDVDQWISVARDAGMKYAVLTAKHVAGHCLWPSKQTTYTVANSTDKTDVIEKFVKACEQRGVMPGFYYCSWDNHNRFGSRTPSDPQGQWDFGTGKFAEIEQRCAADPDAPIPFFTSSTYQSFQTAQITELLTNYGKFGEVWIDIPGVLGRGYREYLYDRIAKLQPEAVIMMNSGISTGEEYNVDYAWPSDLIAIERRVPPDSGHAKWRTIEGAEYYLPGEVCDPIGKDWFWVEGDQPRSDEELLGQLEACKKRGVNLLLDVGPDRHGLIPDHYVQALMRLAKNARA